MTQNTQNGYICLSRGWMDAAEFGSAKSDPFCRRAAWIWLIEHSRWTDGETYIGGKTVAIRRGELIMSVRDLAKEWGWSPQASHRFLHRLNESGRITIETGTGLVHLTICNYETICGHGKDSGTASVQQRYTAGTSNKQGIKEEERKSTPLPPTDLFAEPQPSAADVVKESVPGQGHPKLQPAADAGFDAFMAEYPKRTDREGAKKAYQKLIREGVSPDEILAGVRRTKFPEVRYAQQPKNWLNDRQFMPPPEVARPKVVLNTRL